jgi:hypothetical protein
LQDSASRKVLQSAISGNINTGTAEAKNLDANIPVHIFPNPAFEKIHVHSQLHFNRYELQDVRGRSVAAGTISTSGYIDIQDIAEGIYWLRLVHQGDVYSQKVIIEK